MSSRIGCRWQNCPREYGPYKTVYNRFSRWSERGIWQKIFEAAAAPNEPPTEASLDSSHIKVHRCANGGNVWPALSASGFFIWPGNLRKRIRLFS